MNNDSVIIKDIGLFKDSVLGPIPKEWEVVKIKNIAKVTSGTTPLRSEKKFFLNGNINWVKTTDLNNSLIIKSEEKITEDALSETSLKIYLPNTVLVAMYGGFNQIGRTGILGIEATINQALSALTVNYDEIDPKFLLEWFNAKIGLWKNLAGSSRKDPNITSKDVGDFPFLLIPYNEQKRIASLASCWDKAIEKTTQLITQKEKRKKWLMQQLLTGKKRLKGFEGEWKEVKIGEVFEFIKTTSFTRDDIAGDTSEGNVLYIHYGDIHSLYRNQILDFDKVEKIPLLKSKLSESREFDLLKDGDLIIADASEDYEGVGECIELKNVDGKKAIAGLHTIALRDSSGNTVQGFRSYILMNQIVRNRLRKIATGSSVFGISKTSVSSLLISLPPVEEQTAIASVLQKADNELDYLNLKLHKLKEQKKGLMQVLLTGKKRLKF